MTSVVWVAGAPLKSTSLHWDERLDRDKESNYRNSTFMLWHTCISDRKQNESITCRRFMARRHPQISPPASNCQKNALTETFKQTFAYGSQKADKWRAKFGNRASLYICLDSAVINIIHSYSVWMITERIYYQLAGKRMTICRTIQRILHRAVHHWAIPWQSQGHHLNFPSTFHFYSILSDMEPGSGLSDQLSLTVLQIAPEVAIMICF